MLSRDTSRKGGLSQFFALTAQAIAGTEKDFISGAMGRSIYLLAVPMVLEMLMEALFAIADILFVGFIGADAVATVGFTESVMTIVYSIGIGLSMGTTAMVARRIGEKNKQAAAVAAGQSILIAGLFSALIALPGLFFAGDILRLMGGSDEVVATGSGYTALMLGSNLVIMMLFLLNAVFRGSGDASLAMRTLIIANGLNIVLDPLLIFGLGPIPALGIEGAAIATIIGRSFAVIYQLSFLLRGRGILQLGWSHLIPEPQTLRKLLLISLGGMGQFVIGSASWVFLMRIMSKFGTEAVAGYTIAIRVIIFSILPSWGLANAAATLVGQNMGAGQIDRAEASVWKCAWYNVYYLAILSLLFYLLADPVIGIFSSNPEVISVGAEALRYICLGYTFFAFGMVILQAFNGAGDTLTPTVINVVGYWIIQIPLAYLLATRFDYGSFGVIIAVVIAEICLATISIIIFRQGWWKKTKV